MNHTSVDVFVTACGEDAELVGRCVRAAKAMQGAHTTWLLDDGADPNLRTLSDELGVEYLSRTTRNDAKAGNVNAALGQTFAEIVVIFDIDHIPRSDFLIRSLPFFSDEEVGFVQVMLTFSNAGDSWVSRAAVESAKDFYNATSVGADNLSGVTLVGSNALIRRKALDSIGGYQPGLAEDLATSIALHAAGWKSRYVHEPLAPGLVPPDLAGWFTQQLKWSRGVFELLLTQYPRLFTRLTPGQRISYAVRMTYYWIGLIVGLHLIIVSCVLLTRRVDLLIATEQYFLHLYPLALAVLILRQVTLRLYGHRSETADIQWRALALIFTTWPVYSFAWVMTCLRVPLGYRPTPKRPQGQLHPAWLMPQALTIVLLILGLITVAIDQRILDLPLTLLFVVGAILAQGIVVAKWLEDSFFSRRSRRQESDTAYDGLSSNSIDDFNA